MHFYQFNIGDYHAHTAHLDIEEDLAYRRMMDYCYLHESGLPESIEDIAKKIRMREHCKCIASVLHEFFELKNGEYVNARINSELKSYRDVTKKRKAAANKRWANKHKGLSGDANALQVQSKSNAKQETRNKKQETRNSSDIGTVPAKPKPRKKFGKPDFNLVFSYMKDRGVDHMVAMSESERFIDYYESNGWKVGKNSMKDWKAAVRNWTKNISSGVTTSGQARPNQPKPSLVDRAKQHAEEYFASQQNSNAGIGAETLQPMATTGGNVRPQVLEPIRGEAGRHMGEVFDGDFWPADSDRS